MQMTNGEEPALTGQDADICSRIQRERRAGYIRCGVVEGRMSVTEVARAFGLADDGAIYRSIGSVEANKIATHVLCADLAYSLEIMSVSEAADLWRQFMSLFEGKDVVFVSNAGSECDSWMPATPATFDMGVLVIGTTKAGCLWVEDED
ncbi:hypothetical protein CQ12_17600 [Bradyrhizobium jicamae]|uniref:Uncharacterized protein n=2 Tax=Bradyrhizobium jicamae TaxID=280332 RepID=A0A0R3M0T3_9BRAD|nr:hypothetical protein CQ12_17600 [Bradyrhizobium jicamae]